MKNEILIFSIILSTVAPGIIATTHLSIYIALPSFLLGLIIAYLTYLLVNVKWDYQGLYGYAKDTHPLLGFIFLISWLISYYLYVVYTAIYIPYYVLNLDNIQATIISLFVGILVILALITNPYYAFPAIAFSQIILAIPLGWKLQLGYTPPIPELFTNILSSSLLVVCITLSTFIKGEKKYSPYIIYAVLIYGIALLYGSFLSPDLIGVYASAIGNFGLILAEFTMIRNLLFSINKIRLYRVLVLLSLPIIGIGNINYSLFYNSLIFPSVSLLYLSLFVSFLSLYKYFSSAFVRVLTTISLVLFIYGEYSIITITKSYLFYESVIAITLSVIIALILYYRKLSI